jgi:hypothetical protein
MIELKVLQVIRLKGRIAPDEVADTAREDPSAVTGAITSAIAAGLVLEGKTIRLTPEGRARLAELLAAERNGANRAAITTAYERFRNVNADFKMLVSDWQLRNGEPNPHDDSGYDAAVLGRLADVHTRALPIIADVAREIPRLAIYSVKLSDALAKVESGETMWLTRPLIDSYHTVWFELHEELMQAAGLTREDEAQAGHAN